MDRCEKSINGGGGASASTSSTFSEPVEASTTQCLSVDAIDENLLLAETETILATLDASAFVSAWLSVSSGNAIINVDASAAQRSRSNSTTIVPRPVMTRPPTIDKGKEELVLLREAKTKLESQLAQLQRKNHSIMAVRNAREQTWRKLAERQFRMRQLAEADNAQLKSMMLECLSPDDAHRFTQAFGVNSAVLELPNYAHGPLKRSLGFPQDMMLPSVFESLLHRLDTGYAEMDAVFRENGMDQNLLQPRSYAMKKMQTLGDAHQYLELVDMRLEPFEADLFGDVTWRCNKEWHLKDSPYVYPCAKSSNDTFAVNYRMKNKAFEANESVNYYLVMRRYRQADRCVMMFTAQCDGEMGLAGASSNEIGWLVVSDASLLKNQEERERVGAMSPLPSPTAVIQSCLHITLLGGDSVEEATLNRLTSRLMVAFEEDVAFILQKVDSLMLQESRARSDRHATTDDSVFSATSSEKDTQVVFRDSAQVHPSDCTCRFNR